MTAPSHPLEVPSLATPPLKAAPVRSLPLRAALLASATLALSTVSALGVASAGAATVPHFCYQGSGYGSTAHVGTVVSSGRSALSALGCTDQPGLHHTNTAAGVNRAPLVSSGAVATAVNSNGSPVRSYTTATTQQVSLLNGLVRADAVRAASVTSHDPGFAVSAASTSLTHLVVAGVAVTATPAPNTRINLAGFGYVILNEQTSRITTKSASLTVNGIHLHITTSNPLGIAANTDAVVSSATSGLIGPVAGVLAGHAYGSSVTALGHIANAGRTFPEYLACLGTAGALRTNTGGSTAIANLFSVRTITNTARGTVTPTSAAGELTATVQSAYLLGGLVHATGIKADAHATSSGAKTTLSDTGSRFATLSVRGFPLINAHIAPNTTRVIPGVGTLYLHRVIRTAVGIDVRMIELVLSTPVNGLRAGTDIQIAVAGASAR